MPACGTPRLPRGREHLSILVQCAEELGSVISAAAFTHWRTASPGWGEAWRGGERFGEVGTNVAP